MRDALSLTDQAIAYSANQVTEEAVRGMLGALDQSYLVRLLDALAAGDGAAVLSVADEMALRSLSFSTALQDLASLLHRIAWAQFAPSSVLDEWPEAGDLRRFADALSPEQVQLFYQIATIGRSELGLAPDEYAGFTMTLLRMLAFEPALNGGAGGGPVPAARPGGQSGVAGGRRTGAPAVTAQQAAAPRRVDTHEREQQPVREEYTQHVAPAASVSPVSPAASGTVLGNNDNSLQEVAARQDSSAAEVTSVLPMPQPADAAAPAPEAQISDVTASNAPVSAHAADADADAANDAGESAAPQDPIASESAARQERAADAAQDAPSTQSPTQPSTPQADEPRRAGGASAALDVLRSVGMKLSGERSRPASGASMKVAPNVPPKPAAPRVVVPTPNPARRAQQQDAAPARNAAARPGSSGGATVPPWEEIPPDASGALDDYVPASADDAFFAPPDDGFMPMFDNGADDLRVSPSAAPAPAVVDTRPLPPAVPLDALGFDGDWPALAAGLPLKGISYQLAFNSELMALDGTTLRLNVPVPQYAEAAQVAKLKAALAERLSRPVEVVVEVGPARRTAAALDAAARAQRQQEAEREIGSAPFVQSLIREFGASIVPGSVRPLMPAAQGGPGSASAAH
jgi:DNA polymerase-3 subunit gamma/tau